MKARPWNSLLARYRPALAAYVARGREVDLQRGYELGREALSLGYGVVEVVRLHQEALVKVVSRRPAPVANARWVRAVETFLMEALSAFEVAHRGFREACDRLRRLNGALKDRHRQIAVSLQRLAREVARRKKTQEQLQESELKFRSVIESAQDGILTVDRRGRIVAVNHGAEVLFGYRRRGLVGHLVTRLIPKPQRTAALAALQRLARGGEPQLLERPIQAAGRHRDGRELALEFTLSTWRTRAGVFFTAVARDIRERREAERALHESREHYMRLFEKAREMEENLRRLSSRVLTVQEEERQHISRELHDEIGQSLTAVNVSLALLRKHAVDDEVIRRKVEGAQGLLEQSLELVHQFARDLRPSLLDHLGPVAALQNYIKAFTERTGIKIDLVGEVKVEQLSSQQGTVLYRIAQESLTNVFKHAKATRVKIRLRQLPCAVSMEIADNGSAFPVPDLLAGNARQPLGLLGMQERVRLVNGEFAIKSAPKRGTTVRVQIPLPLPAAPASGRSSVPATTSN